MANYKREKGKWTVKGAAAMVAVLLAVQLGGCQGNGGNGDSETVTRETTAQEAGQNMGEESGLAGGKTAVYEDTDLDTGWEGRAAAVIECSGTDVTVNGDGALEENGMIRITSAGTYILRGTYQGQVQVDAGKEDVVRLVMDGFHISNDAASAVYGMQSGKIVLILADNTENSVSDKQGYVYESSEEDEPDAAIFSKDDLTINGRGSLSVEGNYSNAIRTKDNLKIVSGTLNITAVKDGLKGKDSVSIMDGKIQVKAGQDGIKSSNDKDEEKGFVIIDGGSIVIQAGDDGIHAETWLTINGGDIDVKESYEGLEGLKVDINGGSIKVTSSDDGINAAGGSSGDGRDNGRAKMLDDPEAYVRIAGGTVTVDAMADGIDSNGSLYMDGGAAYINGPVSNGDGALDYNGTAVINNGIFVAVGSSGMMQGFSEDSGQNSALVFYSETQSAGSDVILTGSDGEELFYFTPEKEYSCILFSMPELEQGKTYQLSTDGDVKEVVVSSAVTRIGEQTGRGGMERGIGREGASWGDARPGDENRPGYGSGPEGGNRPEDGKRPEGGNRPGDGSGPEGGNRPKDGNRPGDRNGQEK